MDARGWDERYAAADLVWSATPNRFVEAEQALAGAANITAIPTLMAFREGVLVFAQPGALPPQDLDKVITAVRDLDMEQVHAAVTERDHDAEA